MKNKKTRCKFCKTELEENEALCPVCGIHKMKSKKDLSGQEKKTRRSCIYIKLVGWFYFVGGILSMVAILWTLCFVHTLDADEMDSLLKTGIIPYKPNLLVVLFELFVIILGFSLSKYRRWAFYGATILFMVGIVLCLSNLNILWLIIGVVSLYTVANSTSRKIFLHQ